MTDHPTTVGTDQRLKDFLSALVAATNDPIRLYFGDQSADITDDLNAVLAQVGDIPVFLSVTTTTGAVPFLYAYTGNAQRDQWQDDVIQPTAVLFKDGGLYCAYALEKAVTQDDHVVAVAERMNGFLDDPIPTPGADGWELVHLAPDVFHPFEVLADLWSDTSPQAVVRPQTTDHGGLKDARFLTPLDLDDPAYAQEMVISIGAGMDSKKWAPKTMTVAAFLGLLSEHHVSPHKDGFAFVLAEILGDQRKKTAVSKCYGVGLDIDVGVPGAVIDKALVELGCLAVRYTTHSNGKTESRFPKDRLVKWADRNDADATSPADLARFLREEEHWDDALIASAEYVGDQQLPEGLMAFFSHDPFPKHRIVLPLAEPFAPAFDARRHDEGMKKWGDICRALARALGDLPMDKSAVDPSRLFYFPRHPEGLPFETTFVGGPLLNWRDLALDGAAAPIDANSYEAQLLNEVSRPESKGRSKSTTAEGRALGRWSMRAADGFQIADVIRDHADDRIRTNGANKIDIECPFDETHSNAGDPDDRACFAVNAGDGDSPVFTVRCQHDSCAERTNLDHLGKMVADGWFDREVLVDPAYLGETTDTAAKPTPRMSGGVAIHGVLDGLDQFDPKHCLFTGPTAADDAIDALSKVASVVKMGNKMRIVVRAEDGLGFFSEGEAKLFFKPYRVEIEDGKDKAGQPKIKEVPALDLLLKSERRQTWKGIDCDPSDSLPPYVLNTWQGFEIEPAPGDCSLLKRHIKESMCAGDEDHNRFLLQFFGHMIQKPTEKPGIAPVIIGPKGCGKSTVADFLRRAIGRKHSVKIAQAKHLTGNFNAHLAGRLFVQAEEVTFGGDKKGEGPLKDAITAKTMLTEPKGLDAYQESNFSRFFLVSNPGHAIPASDGERRWFVLQARDLFEGKPMGDPDRIAYFDALYAEADKGGIAAFLDYLMHIDLTGFTPFAAPETDALVDQVRQSLSDEDQWVLGVLESGVFDLRDGENIGVEWGIDKPLEIECSVVQASFASHVRRYGGSSGGNGVARKVLEAHGDVGRRQKSAGGGRPWHYAFGTRREWQEQFTARFGITFPDEGAELG